MSVCAVGDDKSAKMVGVGGNAFSSIGAGELMGHVEQLVVCPEETGQPLLKISALSFQIIPYMICGSSFQQSRLQVARARQESFGIGIAPLEMESKTVLFWEGFVPRQIAGAHFKSASMRYVCVADAQKSIWRGAVVVGCSFQD